MQRILIVDDEPDIRELLDITLLRMGLDTRCEGELGAAIAAVEEYRPDLCLTDMRLPDGNGISLVEYIQEKHPQIPVAMITAHGSVETAIAALKAGAFDFISKPIELERLRGLVTSALQMETGSDGIAAIESGDLIGSAPVVKQLRAQVSKLARSQAPVHIHGESGVGKEVVARLIHRNGPRSAGPFIAVNCGAIPPELMESELFGHIKGSFTGANQDKAGLFQSAAGGTLFLDEVADLPLAMQVKLLRAIQEKAVRPVGGSDELPTDVRVLSATHKDLAAEVAAGHFRNDLYYRINVIDLQVPALRDRREDLPALTEVILGKISRSMDISAPRIAADAMAALANYSFPGNVRELENILERALALSQGELVSAADLQFQGGAAVAAPVTTPTTAAVGTASQALAGAQPTASTADAIQLSPDAAYGDLEGFLATVEKSIISQALEDSRWNRTAAAKLLGISFRSLRYRLKKLGLDD